MTATGKQVFESGEEGTMSHDNNSEEISGRR